MMLRFLLLLLLATTTNAHDLRRLRRDLGSNAQVNALLQNEDTDFMARLLQDFSMSMPPPSCDPACPCCDMPEFVRAIEAYSVNKCQPLQQDCCSAQEIAGDSEVLALVECESPIDPPGYNVAFMSYDYRGEYSGCTLGKTCKLCGDSAFGGPPLVLSDEQADACDALVRSKIEDPDNCPSAWPCN